MNDSKDQERPPDDSLVDRALHEFHRRLDAGESADREQFISEHLGIESKLRSYFAADDLIDGALDATLNNAEETLVLANELKSRLPGRFHIVCQLGKGGFGEVWRAHDTKLGRDVAIKTPRQDRPISEETIRQFVEEARRAQQLTCPGIVPVLDIVIDGDFCCIVMELMQEGNLSQKLQAEVSTRSAVNWIIGIAAALEQLHRSDLVHRDIKPANILFDLDGQPFLSDFGLAATEEELLNEDTAVMGTVAHMPPEQARGNSNRVDRRGDIYSLGVVLYQLLSGGKLPYLARNASEYRRQVLDPNAVVRPLRGGARSVPAQLESICLKCLKKSPAHRYGTVGDLMRDLRAWQNSHPRRLILGAGIIAAASGVGAYKLLFYPRSYEVEPWMWPKDRGSNYRWDHATLHATCSEVGLLAITPQADVDRGCRLSVEISPDYSKGKGRFGVFIGGKIEPVTGMHAYQLFEFMQNKRDGQLYVVRMLVMGDRDAATIARCVAGKPGNSAKKLVMEFSQAGLHQIKWGDEDLHRELVKGDKHTAVEDYRGRHGLFVENTTATFRIVELSRTVSS